MPLVENLHIRTVNLINYFNIRDRICPLHSNLTLHHSVHHCLIKNMQPINYLMSLW